MIDKLPNGFTNISTKDLKKVAELPQPYVRHTGMNMDGFIQIPTNRGDVRVPLNFDVISQVPGGVITFNDADGIQHTVGWLPGKGKISLKVGAQDVGYNANGDYVSKSEDGALVMAQSSVEPKPVEPTQPVDQPVEQDMDQSIPEGQPETTGMEEDTYLTDTDPFSEEATSETVGEALSGPNSYLPSGEEEVGKSEGVDQYLPQGYNFGGVTDFPSVPRIRKQDVHDFYKGVYNTLRNGDYTIGLTNGLGLQVYAVLKTDSVADDVLQKLYGEGLAQQEGSKIQIEVNKSLTSILGTNSSDFSLAYEAQDGNIYQIGVKNWQPSITAFPDSSVVGKSKSGFLVVKLDGKTVETDVKASIRTDKKYSQPLAIGDVNANIRLPSDSKQFTILNKAISSGSLKGANMSIAKYHRDLLAKKLGQSKVYQLTKETTNPLKVDFSEGPNNYGKEAIDLINEINSIENDNDDFEYVSNYNNLKVITPQVKRQ